MNNKTRLTTLATTALLAISVVAAGGAHAATSNGFDAPPLPTELTDAIGNTTEASKPAINFRFDPELPLSPMSQQNAIRSAQSYLDYTAFSREGLIEQLEYDDFSTADATFAVDSITVDWNEQAAAAAQNYLDYTGFSRGGLIEQLEYDGFTSAQAEYGVAAAGF